MYLVEFWGAPWVVQQEGLSLFIEFACSLYAQVLTVYSSSLPPSENMMAWLNGFSKFPLGVLGWLSFVSLWITTGDSEDKFSLFV